VISRLLLFYRMEKSFQGLNWGIYYFGREISLRQYFRLQIRRNVMKEILNALHCLKIVI